MKIMVAVKCVVDYTIKVMVKMSNVKMSMSNVKMSMSPFCKIPLEEALCIQGFLALLRRLWPSRQVTLRTALTMGADQAAHVFVDTRVPLCPLSVAKVLWTLVVGEETRALGLGQAGGWEQHLFYYLQSFHLPLRVYPSDYGDD